MRYRGIDFRRVRVSGVSQRIRYGCGGFVVSELVEERGEHRQRAVHEGEAAGVVVVADRNGQEVESVHRIAVGSCKLERMTATL